MAMKKKEHDNENEKKKGMRRNEASHSPSEGLTEGLLGGQDSVQRHGRVLVITESTNVADRIEFSDPSRAKVTNLHDAGGWARQGGVSTMLIIGTRDYFSHVTHDAKYWLDISRMGFVFLQTDDEKAELYHLKERTTLLHTPLDARKLSDALGIDVTVKPLEQLKEAKATRDVLIVADSKEDSKNLATSFERAFRYTAGLKSDICTHQEFATRKDLGNYRNIFVIDDEENGAGKRSRDILTDRHAMGAKNKGIYLSMSRSDKQREGEILMHVPPNLADLIKVLKG